MTNDLSQNQAKMVAEKTAIIANTAFMLGREAEANRVIEILEKMKLTALDTKTDKGTQTAWVVENAIVLIKGKPNAETN
jgi:hypothetical protein